MNNYFFLEHFDTLQLAEKFSIENLKGFCSYVEFNIRFVASNIITSKTVCGNRLNNLRFFI